MLRSGEGAASFTEVYTKLKDFVFELQVYQSCALDISAHARCKEKLALGMFTNEIRSFYSLTDQGVRFFTTTLFLISQRPVRRLFGFMST